MPFKYVAYDEDGNTIKGSIDVSDRAQAEEAVSNAGYTLINLKQTRSLKLEELFPSLYGIKTEDVINFSRQLATLLDAGLTLPNALQLLELQVERASFKKIVNNVRSDLEGGASFSQSLARYPKAFPDIYCQIAAAGEQSGDLGQSLRQAVDYIERGHLAMKKARRALIYPSFILGVAFVVILVLVTMVLPPMMEMFDTLDTELPLATRILKSITDLVKDYPLIILGGALGIFAAIYLYMRTPSGVRVKDRLLLRLPVISTVVLYSNMALFTRTSSTLLSAGVSLPRIMEMMTETIQNTVMRKSLITVHEGLIAGHGLSRPMAADKIFPPLLVQMITVGEQTGTLDTSLNNVANFYEEEVSNKVDSMMALLEPVIIAGIAIIVGFIALAVISPMYTVLGAVSSE